MENQKNISSLADNRKRITSKFEFSGENANPTSYSAKELYEMGIKEFPTLIDPIFPRTGLTVLAGSSDTGKSTFLRQLAISIVRGDNTFLGWPINAVHNRVIYVSTEDDKYAVSYLLNKTIKDNDLGKYENLLYVFNLDDPFEDLEAILAENPADCIIIDAFSDLFPGDMNRANFNTPYF